MLAQEWGTGGVWRSVTAVEIISINNEKVRRAYSGGLLANHEFLEVIAAYQGQEDNNWFQGTADAMRRCLWVLEQHPATEFLPPPLVFDAAITDSVIGDGCILKRCSIKSSVIGPRTRVGSGAIIQDSVIIGSDIYQRLYKECVGDVDTKQVNVPIGIGEGSHIKKAIIDKNAKIGRNVKSVAAVMFGEASQQLRLYTLTKRRSEGEIPIAGSYRLIDAVISNCINSNITKIYALTQFNSTSLNLLLARAYSGGLLANHEFLKVISPYQSQEDNKWFQGTADAMRRCLWVLKQHPVAEFLVLLGHHLHKMDYQKLIEAHRNNKADVTVAVLDSMRDYNPDYGSFIVDFSNQITGFKEEAESMPVTPLSVHDVKFNVGLNEAVSSMGIYVMNRHVMIKLVKESFPTSNDLKNEVIPGAISLGLKVYAYRFAGYWEDMRIIDAYYKSNMENTKKTNMKYKEFPVYTLPRHLPRHLPPSLVSDAAITDSVIGDGCILIRCSIKSSMIGLRTRVGHGAVIQDSVIMGSDIYQRLHKEFISDVDTKQVNVPIGIREGSHIKKAIIDKNAKIRRNVKVWPIDIDRNFMEPVGREFKKIGKGTADAMRRCLWVLEQHPAAEFLVLLGHHLYKMDYQKLIEAHRNNKADVTVAVLDSIRYYNTDYDSFIVDFSNQITGFKEEAELMTVTPLSVKWFTFNKSSLKFGQIACFVPKVIKVQGSSLWRNLWCKFRPGTILDQRHVMIKLLKESFPIANDLKNEVIPGAISLGLKVHAYRFAGYWEDVRSIEAYYKANMENTKKTNMKYKFYDREFPVYTLPRHLPPSLVSDASITDSVIGDGCILNRLHKECIGDVDTKHVNVLIGSGEGSHIKKSIIDKNAKIGRNVKIINKDNVLEGDNETAGYIITSGIVVVIRDIPKGNFWRQRHYTQI
nr:inactive glucose-1-phosphate adenylyltransferase small subunit 2, chloroplastic [Tanacetum cinerariifolium]